MYTIIAVLIIIVVAFVIQYIFAINKASNKIWAGSGDPLSMSQMLLASLQVNGQVLFGLFTLFVLFVLLKEKIISSEAGLPLFSALSAYLLGKGFREISFFHKNKENPK